MRRWLISVPGNCWSPSIRTSWRSRHSLGRAGWTVRVIRAAVVDTETRRVTHTVDWELPDNRQFLWPLGEGRVLVHVGSELRVYGDGIEDPESNSPGRTAGLCARDARWKLSWPSA